MLLSNQSNAKKTKVRWNIALLMWLAISINYIDRTNLSAATPIIMKQFHISPDMMGIILSAFFWPYALLQVPAGWFSDKIGQRVCLTISVAWWSIATIATAFIRGVGSLFATRFFMGIGESSAFPSCAGVTARWFPDKERGKVSAIYDSGTKIGTAVAMPGVVWLLSRFGWQAPFIISGLLGLIWAVIWWLYYRDPEKHKYANQAEVDYIRDGQMKKEGVDQTQPIKWYQLLRYRNIWAMCIGFTAFTFVMYFFITWFPTYLVQEQGMSLLNMGFVAMIPPLTGFVAELIGGWLTDYLYMKGLSLSVARKINLVGGMLLATSIAFAAIVHSTVLAVVLFSLSYAGLEIAAAAIMALPGDVAPKNMTSIVFGLQNAVSNLGGALAPIVVGLIIAKTHSFVLTLLFSGVITLIGAITYLFWLGKVEPIDVEKKKDNRSPLSKTVK
ncbi:MFS transporter [Scopulibacillus cellulosilyticus]|uniref:MFS transporter n=1 Tax=Scopulibacillus cellulosilyticus TaxID=2665665 RepID=A0ABW2Q3A6_9BACL